MRIHRIGQTKEVKIRRFIIKVPLKPCVPRYLQDQEMLIVRNLLENVCKT